MLCEICQSNIVTKKIQFVLGNTTKEFNVCHQCAEKHDVQNPFAGLPGALNVLMFGQLVKSLAPEMADEDHSLTCKNCGTTITKFRQTGTLGCPKCYDSFKNVLVNLLNQIHGSVKHIGSRPAKQRKKTVNYNITELKKQLATAILEEKYERAAELRDLIRDVETLLIIKQ